MNREQIIEILERFGQFIRGAKYFGSEDYEEYADEIITLTEPEYISEGKINKMALKKFPIKPSFTSQDVLAVKRILWKDGFKAAINELNKER